MIDRKKVTAINRKIEFDRLRTESLRLFPSPTQLQDFGGAIRSQWDSESPIQNGFNLLILVGAEGLQ